MKVSVEAKELEPGGGRGNLSNRLVFHRRTMERTRRLHSRATAALAVRGMHRIFQKAGEKQKPRK